MSAALATVMHSRQIPLTQLRAHPANIRDSDGDVTELAESIRQVGMLQPIVVCPAAGSYARETVYVVLAGHRRFKAIRQLGWTSAPCTVRPAVKDLNEARIVMLVENLQRSDLSAAEKARAFGAMRNTGMTLRQIGERVGLGIGTVAYFLRLLDLDPATLDRLEAGEFTVAVAQRAVMEVRRAEHKRNPGRRGTGTPMGRPPVVEPYHFTAKHPLAAAVGDGCHHSGRPYVGRVGCGQCWEAAIRADERELVEACPADGAA